MNFFKIVFFCFAAVFLFSSCSKCVDTNLIFGNWKDTQDYPISYFDANGDSVFMKFPNIIYHLNKDGTYTLENEVPIGIPCDGQFSFINKSVFFTTECIKNKIIPFIGIDGIARYKIYTGTESLILVSWDLLTLNDKEMEVNFIYASVPISSSLQKLNISFKRKFKRV